MIITCLGARLCVYLKHCFGLCTGFLAEQLLQENGIEFFAKPRRNMKNRLMCLSDRLLARKRVIIESIIDAGSAALRACIRENADQLKNIFHIEHSQGKVREGCLRALNAVTSQPR